MDAKKRLLIVIATYNEAESLPSLVSQLRQSLPTAQLLIIDDNSPDGTGKLATQYADSEENVSVMLRSGKLGLGSAAVAGFKSAFAGDFDWVATLDADLSHDPDSLQQMFHLAIDSSTDLVIGSRYVAGGQIIGWPLRRRITSYLTNFFARFVLGLKTKDNTSAMRIYRVSTLRKIDVDSISSQGYSYLEEILLKLKKISAKTTEFPITFQDRETGQSKADFAEIIGSLRQFLILAVRRR